MKATLIIRSREIVDGILVEMVAWSVPVPVAGCAHRFKYRFYAGRLLDGTCLVRYDNERGKGDHRHIDNGEQEPYNFTSLVALKNDFMYEVQRWIRENRP